MLSDNTNQQIKKADAFSTGRQSQPPAYNAANHYIEVGRSDYFHDLTILRHIFRVVCDDYMSNAISAFNVDMYMYTPSASSPMGPGSDSKPVHFEFGGVSTFLTDSAQFGFEPLMLNGIDKAYSYLPSLRGEEADNRHLNQFYHTEIEILGNREDAIKIAEDLVRSLCTAFAHVPKLMNGISKDSTVSLDALQRIADAASFPRITFDKACATLQEHGYGNKYVNETPKGRDISSMGEIILMEILDNKTPIWMTDFDRDRVAFYQKPNPEDKTKVLNADLLFPPLIKDGFGGEIVGLGQRQDNVDEIMESLLAQEVSAEPYEWYIDLRRDPRYKTTAGFGLGIERFIAWSLGLTNIRDAILYPRIKGEHSNP